MLTGSVIKTFLFNVKQNANILVRSFTQNRAKKSTIFHVFPRYDESVLCCLKVFLCVTIL